MTEDSVEALPGRRHSFRPGWRDDAAIACAIALLGLFYIQIYKPGGADDAYYLGQLSSIIEDGDLDLRNDLLWMVNSAETAAGLLTHIQPSGRLNNLFSIGPALIWSPAYAAGRAWARLGLTEDPRRWGAPHVVALQALALAFLGATAWMARRLARRCGLARGDALAVAIALVVASPLLYYGFQGYGGPHSAGACIAFLYWGLLPGLARRPSPARGFAAGLALGLLGLIRWQDALHGAAIPIVLAGGAVRGDWRRLGGVLAAAGAGVALMFSIQSHAWLLERGTPLTLPQGGDYVHWLSPRAKFLLAGYHGLLPWSPIYALAAAGFAFRWRLRLPASFRWAALAVLALEVYVNSCVEDWWGGSAYGPRRMVASLPVALIGLANLVPALPRRGAALALAPLMLWGVITMNLRSYMVEDLALIALGRPSAGAPPSGAGEITDAARARAALFKRPLRVSRANYFEYDFLDGAAAGRLLTLALCGAIIIAAAMALRTARRWAGAGSLALYLAIVLGFHARLALRPDAPGEEHEAWGRLSSALHENRFEEAGTMIERGLARNPGPADEGSPRDAYLYLAMWMNLKEGRGRVASEILAHLRAKQYQALELIPAGGSGSR